MKVVSKSGVSLLILKANSGRNGPKHLWENVSLQPGCLPSGGNFLTGHSKDPAAAANFLNSGHDFTVGPRMQHNVSKNATGEP